MARKPSSKIHFHWKETVFPLKNRLVLKIFLEKLFKREGIRLARVDYVFCTDSFLLKLNQEFLKGDYLTDTISFRLSDPGEALCGEIYISIARIRENARLYGTGLQNELHRVIFHGSLHLCGFYDKTPSEKLQMKIKEDEYLKMLAKK